jgi:serine/threonine protein kinase/Flp pilus assembly protein TadD
MTDQRLSERSIFEAAIEKGSPQERAAHLDQACGSDSGLRQQVEALLAAHERLGDIPLPTTAEEPAVSERPGTLIGPYKLLERIGEGGFGVVFMAEQTQPLRRKVALKVLKPGMDTRQVVARFEAERQALALMDHPNIARVFDGGETTTGRPYFVMELVKGIPITNFCDQNHLSIRERLELFVSVCQAVQHAHQKGIIHRDLKPSNVLVTVHDTTPVVKVIDFGVAKALGQELTDKTLFTGFAQMVGTPLYMSPEQAGQSGLDIDTRSDIYTLAVLLYELLTGTTPFDKERLRTVGYDEMRRILREEEAARPSMRVSTLGQAAATVSANRKSDPKRLSELCRGELDWIVMKALEKDRNRRYETSNSLARDLQRYLADEPVEACPPSVVYRLRKLARRHKQALAAAIGVLLALIVLASTIGYFLHERQTIQAEQRQEIESSLEKASELRRRGHWVEARVVLEEALVRLGEKGPSDLRRKLDLARADLDLVDRLESIRLRRAVFVNGYFDNQRAERDYAAAFREGGLGEEGDDAGSVAARIRASAIREQLVAALDDWAAVTNQATRRGWLLRVARLADPDAWRDRFRDPKAWNDPTALKALADELLRDQTKLAQQKPQLLVSLGNALISRSEDAVPLLAEAQARHPDDFWINFTLGNGLHVHHQWDEGLVYFRVAVALRPESAAAHDKLGWMLYELKRLDEAIREYNTALTLDPKSDLSHANLGMALLVKNQLDEAIREHRTAIDLNPKWPLPHVNLGITLRAKNQLDEAIREFRTALDLFPNWAIAHVNLGSALLAKDQLDEAVHELRTAIDLDPKYPQAHAELGRALFSKKQPDEAVHAFRTAINLNPKDAVPHFALGYVLRTMNQGDEAIREFRTGIELAQKAVELAPCNDWYWKPLGFAHYYVGTWKEAIAALEKSMQLRDGGDNSEWFFLAMAHWQLGEKERARKWFDQAVQWMDKNKPKDKELGRLRAEAAELLGVDKKNK